MRKQYVGGSLGSLGKTGTEKLRKQNNDLRKIDELLMLRKPVQPVTVDPGIGDYGHYITIDRYGRIQLIGRA